MDGTSPQAEAPSSWRSMLCCADVTGLRSSGLGCRRRWHARRRPRRPVRSGQQPALPSAWQRRPPDVAARPTQRPRPRRLGTATGAHASCRRAAGGAASFSKTPRRSLSPFRAAVHPLSLSVSAVGFEALLPASFVAFRRGSYSSSLESSQSLAIFHFAARCTR